MSVRMLCVALYLIMLCIEYVVYCAAGGEGERTRDRKGGGE